MTRNQDRQCVGGDGGRYITGIARRAHLGGDSPVARGGSRRDLTQEVPDFLLIVRAADIERDSRILVGVIDEMGEGSNSFCHGHGVFR